MAGTQEKKLQNAKDIMKEEGIPFWLVFSEEGRDPVFKKVAGSNTVPAILVATPNNHRIIVSGLEKDNFSKENLMVWEGRAKITETINNALQELGFNPQKHKIAFNYSTLMDSKTDFLGYGITSDLVKSISERFGSFEHVSAENIIYGLYDRKSPGELEKMTVAAVRANEILDSAFNQLRSGMSELQAYELVHKIMSEEKPNYFDKKGVVAETFAWEKDHCPVMLTGPNLQKGGHAETSDAIIQEGHTLYFDFGVKLTFEDGTSWCSDIQRMGYVLKKGESKAPNEVQKVFDTLIEAIDIGINALKPGVPGYVVDKAVRGHTVKAYGKIGDYGHATGHGLGEFSHNPGAVLSLKENKKARLLVQPWGVYTIEPRITMPNGGSIEEDVVVNPDGENYTLCPRQKKLYLVN